MVIIDKRNSKAIALKKKIADNPDMLSDLNLAELKKTTPYYGYVDITVGKNTFTMFSNNDDFVAHAYFWQGVYEPLSLKLWTALAETSPVALDIGSYTGIYALSAATNQPKTKVYAFEALDRVYTRALVNIDANICGNLHLYNYAVADKEGEIELNIYAGSSILVSGSSIFEKNVGREIYEKTKVDTISIDNFMKTQPVERIGIMKIDTEGAEHLVVKGAMGVIKRFRPSLLCEFLEGAHTEEIEEMLTGLGYKFYRINDKEMSIEEIVSITTSNSMDSLNTLITTHSLSELTRILKEFDNG